MISEYKKLDGSISKIENLKPNFKSVVIELQQRIIAAHCNLLEIKVIKDTAIRYNEATRYFLCFSFANTFSESLSILLPFDGKVFKAGKLSGKPIDATINCEGVHKTII
jgi:hypothetical protein